MDETDETTIASAGERLRAAREEKGLSLEDIAAQTRIPRRHLESLELGEWNDLPAPTYSIGFAKSYAAAVGLDRADIGEQLRTEMGGTRSSAAETEVFQAADPARTMPKWLILGAIAAVIALVLALTWYSRQSLEPGEVATADAPAEQAQPAAPAAVAPAAPAAEGPVVITANEPVWIQVYERGGGTLFQGELAAGQRYDVPATATAPLLRTGKPEALRVSVGTADAPPIGPAATTVSNVSLLGPDLMGSGQAAAPAQPQPQPQPQPR